MSMRMKFRQWLSQRFQYHGVKTLRQNDVLVFIYKQGFLYLVLILITFIAGINYANNLILGFCFLMSAILCISFYVTFKQLHALSIEVIAPKIGRSGDALTLRLSFKQATLSPKYLQIRYANQVEPVLLQQLNQQVELIFQPTERGWFVVPEIQIFSTYPLGLVRAWTYCYFQGEIWIAPKAMDFLKENSQASSSGEPDLDEFRELRAFREGDSLQAVSWKQAARGQGLYIKQFEDQFDAKIVEIDYAQMPSTSHEERLSLMMGMVDRCEAENMLYSMKLPTQQLVVGHGETQFFNAQLMLAKA